NLYSNSRISRLGRVRTKGCHDRRERGADLRDKECSWHVSANRTHVPHERRDTSKFLRNIVDLQAYGACLRRPSRIANLALKLDRDVSKGCERALAELRSKKDSGFRRGEMWELWVRKLTAILSKSELPTQVRKDADKTKATRPSPFVSFIRELQVCLPEKYRRS